MAKQWYVLISEEVTEQFGWIMWIAQPERRLTSRTVDTEDGDYTVALTVKTLGSYV